ncbi:solute carrier organic anion transporter family member 4C1-like [Amphiura filiformis]|uniref:solute carrier organic anion transporter family member 4C1-like n=1 Tax=Amphiura filiformis TaxID=82378 RepID=UPI003B221FCC
MTSEYNGKVKHDDYFHEIQPMVNKEKEMLSEKMQEKEEPRHGRRTDCGWFSFRPAALRRCNSAPWLLAILCCYNLLHGSTCNGFTNVAITSIERRFELSSSRSGLIPPTYDIVAAFVIVVVSFLGSQGSKPRWLASGMLILSIGSVIFTVPHFVTGLYDYGQDSSSTELCPRDHNGTTCGSGENSISALSNNLYIFILAQVFFGIGTPAVYSLGVTFLDESVSTRRAGLYLGIFSACTIIGPAIGYIIGGIFLNFFTDFMTVDTSSLGIDTASPRWVGAWWLGHLIAAVLMFLLVIPLSCFPPELKGTQEIQSKRISQVFSKSDEEDAVVRSKKGSGVKWQHLPTVVKSVLTNPTFIVVTVSSAADSIFIGGAEVFLPKYLETQFGLTASFAALQTGVYLVLFGGGGLVAAGWAIKKFSLKIPGMLRFCLVTSFICMISMIGQILSCREIPLAGISVPYIVNRSNAANFAEISVTNECNVDCLCSTEQFLPVCGTHNDITYFSPCHAGCSLQNEQTNEYHNCSCIEDNLAANLGNSGLPSSASLGLCGEQCWQYYTYSVLLAIVMCTLLMNGTLYVNILLRCVLDHSRDYALGIYGFIVRVFGSFAGPILFGALIDDTCILWHEECDERGRCWAYNRNQISLYMLVTGFCVKAFTVFLFGIVVYTYKPPKSKDDENLTSA